MVYSVRENVCNISKNVKKGKVFGFSKKRKKRNHLSRDVNETLRSETETFPLFPRSRPRPRRSILGPRRDRDVDRPRPRHFSRPWHVELHYLKYFCLA